MRGCEGPDGLRKVKKRGRERKGGGCKSEKGQDGVMVKNRGWL